jgi:hypothetical protein
MKNILITYNRVENLAFHQLCQALQAKSQLFSKGSPFQSFTDIYYL